MCWGEERRKGFTFHIYANNTVKTVQFLHGKIAFLGQNWVWKV